MGITYNPESDTEWKLFAILSIVFGIVIFSVSYIVFSFSGLSSTLIIIFGSGAFAIAIGVFFLSKQRRMNWSEILSRHRKATFFAIFGVSITYELLSIWIGYKELFYSYLVLVPLFSSAYSLYKEERNWGYAAFTLSILYSMASFLIWF
jgi:hypothetical protein